MKVCSKCGETKPLEEFSKAPRYRDGRRGECKPCRRSAHREWHAKNRERVRDYNKRYHQENRDNILKRKRAYDAANPQRAADYYQAHREEIRARQRASYVSPPGLMDREQTLYRLFDSEGTLLYVGITVNFQKRFTQHRRERPWFPRVDTWTVETYPDRAQVRAAESLAIRTESPIFNVHQKGIE